jgi:hypothetical protein
VKARFGGPSAHAVRRFTRIGRTNTPSPSRPSRPKTLSSRTRPLSSSPEASPPAHSATRRGARRLTAFNQLNAKVAYRPIARPTLPD